MIFENLYKFQSVNINAISALSDQSLWFSKQESFNDPFEGIFKLDNSCSDSDLINLGVDCVLETQEMTKSDALQQVNKRFSQNPTEFRKSMTDFALSLNDRLREYAKNCGILSLSADIPGDDRSHVANMLMWSHYGDGLRGYCLQFHGQKLYKSFSKLNIRNKFSWAKMDYDRVPRTIGLFSGADSKKLDYLKALQIKHEQWDYECECRIFSNSVGLNKFSKDALKAIYIGEKMPENEELLLVEIMERQYPEADIFKVKIETDSFSIKIGRKM